MNYYRRYMGDFQSATMALSMMEQGAYDRLLDFYYATEKPIPLNPDRAAIICRAVTMEERAAVDLVLKTYFEERPDGWHNKRADEEISKAQPEIEAARSNGSRGGRPKKKTQEKPSGFISDNPAGSQNETQQKPNGGQPPASNHQPPEKQSAARAPEPEPLPPTPLPEPAPAEAVPAKLTAKDYVSILGPHDILTNVFDQVLIGWALSEIPAARVEEAIVIAKRRKGGERIHTRYLDPIVRDPAATTAPVPAAKSGKDQAEAKVAKTAAQVAEQASWKADPMPESMRKFVHKAGSA